MDFGIFTMPRTRASIPSGWASAFQAAAQIPYDHVVHSIRLLTEKVIPKFK